MKSAPGPAPVTAAEPPSPPTGVVDLAIRGGVVLASPDVEPTTADLYVDGDRVVAFGGPHREAHRTVDASGMLVLPAMHNLHDHLREMSPGVAAGEGLRLDEILRFFWRLSESAGVEEYEVMACLSSARLLLAGMTSVVDHLYPLHRPGLVEASVAGAERAGIRYFVGRGVMTRGYDPICEPPELVADRIRVEAGDVVPIDRLMIAPVSFRQAPVELYREARLLADELGARLYTHVAETEAEVEMTVREHGLRPVELLDSLGFTGPDTTLVHCVLLSDREIDILARTGTSVVHCPTNHMKLAKGFTPVPRLLEAGVNVALGVDCHVSVLREMRQEVLLQSIHHADPGVLSPETAVRMATRNGANALGMGHALGTLDVGMTADVVCVDLTGVHNQPVLDPLWTMVLRSETSDVTHVVVAGEVVVENRRLSRVDLAEVVQVAGEVIGRFLDGAGIAHPLSRQFQGRR